MEKKVSIWAGHFANDAALKMHAKEIYNNNGDVVCHFWQDFGIDFVDNNFQEVLFIGTPITLASFSPFSYSESFPTSLLNINLGAYNSLVLIYDYEYAGEVLESDNLKFLGSFNYTEE